MIIPRYWPGLRAAYLLSGWPLVLLLCVGAGCSRDERDGGAGLTIASATAQSVQESIATSRRTAITEAVARVAPAVVTVQTETVDRSVQDPFDLFFRGRSGPRVMPGIGSGFIVREDGVIVTNAHVVSDASRILVALTDGTTYPATLVGKDDVNDIAVLRIDARGLPVATLASSADLLIGEWVIAIGNPYGFLLGNPEPSVTSGVISGTGRNLVARAEGSGVYVDMIQTDAAINPGNSGGPLVNALGEVIGMNSSIYSPTGASVGLGFAIPINRVVRVTEDLLAHGAVRRPWVGLRAELPQTRSPRPSVGGGFAVASVIPRSPAEVAGIRAGDQLIQSRGRALRNSFDWEAELLDMRVGEQVPLVLRRNGRDVTVTVTVSDLPEVTAPKIAVLRELELVTVTPAIRAQRQIRSARGALIFNVSQRVAEQLGIGPGDVIVQVNQLPIESAEDAARALDSYGGRSVIRMFFERGGRIHSTDFMIR